VPDIYQEAIMDEHHLAAWQIAEFILGGLDEDELEEVYRHFDECGECVRWLAGVDLEPSPRTERLLAQE